MILMFEKLLRIAIKNGWSVAEPGRAVIAWPGSKAIATDASFVSGHFDACIFALPGSRITAESGAIVCGSHDTSIVAKEGSIILAHPGCSVAAMQGAIVWAFPGAYVTGNARVWLVENEADVQLAAGALNAKVAIAAHQFFHAVVKALSEAVTTF